MNRKINLVFGLLVSAAALIAILVLFSTAFGSDSTYGVASTRGNGFQVMFGYQDRAVVVPLVIAFVLQAVAILLALIACIMPGKISMFGLGIAGICLAAGSVLFLMAPTFYVQANAITTEIPANGTGTILTAVFGFIGALLGLYGAYRVSKA